ncbi:hypothetical protein SASPL_152458 [Salvia splendens]|uniref:Uncharacterized protein n=1 Tax=Salvia splendens TaxID=180675 RepID=A0A8X8W3X4_SALSN|nr:hypothetical protein SASPL_152458 [Salvia splendens]
MAERRHGGRRGDARGGDSGSRPTATIGATGEASGEIQPNEVYCAGASFDGRSIISDVVTSYDADEPSKNSNSNIFSMPVYDTPIYDENIFYELPEPPKNSNNNILSMPVYDKPVYDEDILSMSVNDDKSVYDEDILSMPVYDKPVYDEDIFYELPGLMSKSSPPSVKFDDAAEEEGVAVDDDEEYDEAEGENCLLGFMFGNVDGVGDLPREKAEFRRNEWRYFLHYLGWNKNWDELLGMDRQNRDVIDYLVNQKDPGYRDFSIVTLLPEIYPVILDLVKEYAWKLDVKFPQKQKLREA